MIKEPTLVDCDTTVREKEVLSLLADGYTTREIAAQLYISYHTADTHRKNLKLILKAKNSIHMVAKAVRRGVI